MNQLAELDCDGQKFSLPIIEGTAGERGVDVTKLLDRTGLITLDPGFGNTGSCMSRITFIDGDKGILRYRGIPIEELAEKSTFIETAYLIIYGQLPTHKRAAAFLGPAHAARIDPRGHEVPFRRIPAERASDGDPLVDDQRRGLFLPGTADPHDPKHFNVQAARLISQVRTIAAFAYRKSRGLPIIYPKPIYKYSANFLHMMFSQPYADYELKPEVVRALDLIFLLHADHEQNCSTSTVRMVASSRANLFASAAAGVCALWGPLHGGANQAVLEMLEEIHKEGDDGSRFVAAAKEKKSGRRLMGFGHRVYKNYDPRAKIIKQRCDELLDVAQGQDPLLDIALHLEAGGDERSLFHRAQTLSERRFLQRHHDARHRHPAGNVHRSLRHRPHAGLDRQLQGGRRGSGQPHLPPPPDLHGRAAGLVRPDRPARELGNPKERGLPVFVPHARE